MLLQWNWWRWCYHYPEWDWRTTYYAKQRQYVYLTFAGTCPYFLNSPLSIYQFLDYIYSNSLTIIQTIQVVRTIDRHLSQKFILSLQCLQCSVGYYDLDWTTKVSGIKCKQFSFIFFFFFSPQQFLPVVLVNLAAFSSSLALGFSSVLLPQIVNIISSQSCLLNKTSLSLSRCNWRLMIQVQAKLKRGNFLSQKKKVPG